MRERKKNKEKNQLQKTESSQEEILLGEHENSSIFIVSFERKNKISSEKMHNDVFFNPPKLGYLLE